WGKLIRQPDQIGGVETQSDYVVVKDTDLIYEKVKAAGAKIVIDIKFEEYGGRGLSCLDLEGGLWSIGRSDHWRPRKNRKEKRCTNTIRLRKNYLARLMSSLTIVRRKSCIISQGARTWRWMPARTVMRKAAEASVLPTQWRRL